MVQKFQQSQKHFFVCAVNLVEVLQFVHLREGEAEVLKPFDEFKALYVQIGIESFPSLSPFDRMEETHLLIVADRPGAHSQQVSELPDFQLVLAVHVHLDARGFHLT
jgi:hypothetical protein